MAGTVRKRTSYQEDVAYLTRLARSIEKDDDIPDDDKRQKVIDKCNRLAMDLLTLRDKEHDGQRKAG